MTPQQQEALDLVQKYGTIAGAARETGIPPTTLRSRIQAAERYNNLDPAIREGMEKLGMQDVSLLKGGWLKGDGASFRFSLGNDMDIETIEDRIDAACDRLAKRSEVVVKPKYDGGNHMLVITPADIHMGKLCEAMETGDTYTLEIAERRTKEGVAGLLVMGAYFGLECITVNTGNDSLHVDNAKSTTTAGTFVSSEVSIFTMYDAMFDTWVWILEEAAKYAPVHVVFDPSNHPWVSDWMLNRSLMAHFRNDKRVTFDVSMNSIRHRKYQVYGTNLIGYTHGDGAKEKDLPNLMQHECREWWGKTRRGYWIIKHKHHSDGKMLGMDPYQFEKDHIGVTVIRTADKGFDRNVSVEVVRSPSGADGWHDRNAFVGAIKAVEAFLFHAERGQISRFTYPFY